MRCVVTAGPTYEPLDEVRRLTNFSTGRLGTELAAHLARAGHRVVLLRGELSNWAVPAAPGLDVVPFSTTASLEAALRGTAGTEVGAVLHAAAVSDFRFGAVWAREPDGRLVPAQGGKLTTRGGALLAELEPTPKLIARLRDWFPAAWLAGWKYGVEGGPVAVLGEAEAQLAACHTDVSVANGPAYGDGFGIVRPGQAVRHCRDRTELYEALAAWLAGASRHRL
jgi:phosphopantothenoylcysteine decarboxylase/phosphopantothenate--cysteine ligase